MADILLGLKDLKVLGYCLGSRRPIEPNASMITSAKFVPHALVKYFVILTKHEQTFWILRICGMEIQVYNASNVEIITKTRTEHLLDKDKEQWVESFASSLHDCSKFEYYNQP